MLVSFIVFVGLTVTFWVLAARNILLFPFKGMKYALYGVAYGVLAVLSLIVTVVLMLHVLGVLH